MLNCFAARNVASGLNIPLDKFKFWRFLRPRLVRLFNACLRLGQVSNLWKWSEWSYFPRNESPRANRSCTDRYACWIRRGSFSSILLPYPSVLKDADIYSILVNWWFSFLVDSGFDSNDQYLRKFCMTCVSYLYSFMYDDRGSRKWLWVHDVQNFIFLSNLKI